MNFSFKLFKRAYGSHTLRQFIPQLCPVITESSFTTPNLFVVSVQTMCSLNFSYCILCYANQTTLEDKEELNYE